MPYRHESGQRRKVSSGRLALATHDSVSVAALQMQRFLNGDIFHPPRNLPPEMAAELSVFCCCSATPQHLPILYQHGLSWRIFPVLRFPLATQRKTVTPVFSKQTRQETITSSSGLLPLAVFRVFLVARRRQHAYLRYVCPVIGRRRCFRTEKHDLRPTSFVSARKKRSQRLHAQMLMITRSFFTPVTFVGCPLSA